MRRWPCLFLLMLCLIGAWPSPLRAEEGAREARLRELLLELEDRDRGEAAVAALVASNDARVKPLLERLLARELYLYQGQVVYAPETQRDAQGAAVMLLRDPLSGEPLLREGQPLVVPAKDLRAHRHSGARQARRAAKSALAVIDLTAADPALRRAAARRVGDSGEAEALPHLARLAEQDPDPQIRHLARESLLLIQAQGRAPETTAAERLAAIAQLGAMRSTRARPLIAGLAAAPEASGLPPAALAPVAAEALAKIDRHLATARWLSYAFQGISAASVLVLLALGLAITFGVMGVINMAHGEMLMIGAVASWACFEFLTPVLPADWGNWYYVAAFPLSFLAAALVGLTTEALIVRRLYTRPLDSLLATIGVSFILIQSVRLWKGDNLGMSAPSWFTGGVEALPDVILPYNRLFVIALAALCVAGTIAMFRFTRLGLMIRATMQNRDMAQSLGVNTRRVDMLTFAFGAGLAGLAGYAIVLLSNPTPEMGQGYIVQSFLVVVVGGVGNLAGVVLSGLGLGVLQKVSEPFLDATWAQVLVLLLVVLFIQRRPGGLFPEKGRMADQADRSAMPWIGGASRSRSREILLGAALALLGLVVVPALYLGGAMSLETVNKLGHFVAFALVAVGLDLVWGYMGVLSLCQFLFFALGGYAMGLHLVAHGPKDIHGIPQALAYVMSDVADPNAPWFLKLFEPFPAAVLLGLLLPALLALLIGVTTFRSRVRGVYFAILTQAITVAFWLVFQKNELKLGGTNGLTGFDTLLGAPLAGPAGTSPLAQTRFWLYIASVVALLLALAVAKCLVRSGFGRVLIAIRDDETRLLFRGYRAWAFKTAAFIFAAVLAGLGGMLYVPQKGIITPHQIAAAASIMVVVWVALGGRGTLWGAALGAIAVNLLYDWLTSRAPELWPFALGALFILVPLFLPGGLMSLPALMGARLRRLRPRRLGPMRAEARGQRRAQPRAQTHPMRPETVA